MNVLEKKEVIEKENLEVSRARKSLQKKYDKLTDARDLEIKAGKTEIDRNTRLKLQEAHLVTGQLKWLLDISEKLQENVEKIKLKEDE